MKSSERPPVIGLLGGVGSGKSTVAQVFRKLGALVVDADREARSALDEPAVRAAVADRFGPSILAGDGSIDRKALAGRVFGAGREADRRALEAIVHPRVLDRIADVLEGRSPAAEECPLVVLDVPLLLETPLADRCDRLVFVDAPRPLREERARSLRGWDEGELARREDAQASPAEKKRRADHVLRNDGTIEDLERGASRLFAILTGRHASG